MWIKSCPPMGTRSTIWLSDVSKSKSTTTRDWRNSAHISRAFGGPATVEAFSQKLFKPRSWGPMAESETYAHLEHLRIAGRAERSNDSDGKFLYLG